MEMQKIAITVDGTTAEISAYAFALAKALVCPPEQRMKEAYQLSPAAAEEQETLARRALERALLEVRHYPECRDDISGGLENIVMRFAIDTVRAGSAKDIAEIREHFVDAASYWQRRNRRK